MLENTSGKYSLPSSRNVADEVIVGYICSQEKGLKGAGEFEIDYRTGEILSPPVATF